MDDTAGFWERTIRSLSLHHPLDGAVQHLVVDEDVSACLVEGFGHKCREPTNRNIPYKQKNKKIPRAYKQNNPGNKFFEPGSEKSRFVELK